MEALKIKKQKVQKGVSKNCVKFKDFLKLFKNNST